MRDKREDIGVGGMQQSCCQKETFAYCVTMDTFRLLAVCI